MRVRVDVELLNNERKGKKLTVAKKWRGASALKRLVMLHFIIFGSFEV